MAIFCDILVEFLVILYVCPIYSIAHMSSFQSRLHMPILSIIVWSNYLFIIDKYGESNFKHNLIKTGITLCLNPYHCEFDQYHCKFEKEAICYVAKYEEQC